MAPAGTQRAALAGVEVQSLSPEASGGSTVVVSTTDFSRMGASEHWGLRC